MPSMIIACPACGSKSKFGPERLGQKVQCPCGMSFTASPVFAVPEGGGGGPAWLSGLAEKLPPLTWQTGLAVVGFMVLLGASAGVATWLMNRPSAAQPDPNPATADTTPRPSTRPKPPEPKVEEKTQRPVAPEPKTPPKADTPAKAVPENSRPAPPPPPPPPTPAESLRASRLWDAFDLDRDQARARYASKLIELTATGKLQRDADGRAFFGAQVVKPGSKASGRLTPQEQHWEKVGYPPNVICYLAPGQASELAGLSPGQESVLRGVVRGRRDDPHVYGGYVVVLENCRVVKPAR
jgi:hypothetical protein